MPGSPTFPRKVNGSLGDIDVNVFLEFTTWNGKLAIGFRQMPELLSFVSVKQTRKHS